jgi:hypothetical protein
LYESVLGCKNIAGQKHRIRQQGVESCKIRKKPFLRCRDFLLVLFWGCFFSIVALDAEKKSKMPSTPAKAALQS